MDGAIGENRSKSPRKSTWSGDGASNDWCEVYRGTFRARPQMWCHAFDQQPLAMLTVMDDDRHVFHALQRGASGYLLKNTPLPRIVEALGELHAGSMTMSVPVARRVLTHFREASTTPNLLTNREQEVLLAMTQGLSQRAIADSLHLSRSTVNFHVQRIYEKLHVNSAGAAVARALRDRLV